MQPNTIYCATEADWRSWLKANHTRTNAIWLLFLKGHDHDQSLTYSDALDDALCFGWIDSLIKRIDDERYARKFSRRRAKSKWSAENRKRIGRLQQSGLMDAAGIAVVDAARIDGSWEAPDRPVIREEARLALEAALEGNATAGAQFGRLPPSHKREYLAWISSAKRAETQQRRIRKAVTMLEAGKRLGMK